MFESYDESELLAYIEDSLDASRARLLRDRLAKDPAVAELLDAMRDDRALLASEPEPPMPADFAAEVEPMLVRPMLMQAFDDSAAPAAKRPGEQRRQQRRQRRLQSVRRFAVAAAFVMFVGGGVWYASTVIDMPGAFRVASSPPDDAAPQQPLSPQRQAAIEAWDDQYATVHHLLPPPIGAVSSGPNDAQMALRGSGGGEPIISPVVLHVYCQNVERAEQALVELATTLPSPTALVQNFSYDEARQIERAWLLSRDVPGREQTRPVTASRTELNLLAQRVRDQQRQRRTTTEQPTLSGQLVGESDQAAPFTQQLAFSSHGATHTVTIPAGHVRGFLAKLAQIDGQHTSLQSLADDSVQGFSGRAVVASWVEQLNAANEEAVVHLPVRIMVAD